MIEEDHVSFEVAKLLKEQGFNEPCRGNYYWDFDDNDNSIVAFGEWTAQAYDNDFEDEMFICSAPTLQMTMKWLEEVHHILVVADYVYECTNTSWVYKIYRLGKNGKPKRCAVKGVSYYDEHNPSEHIIGYRDYELSHKDYATREEAETEGIRYVLEKYV